MVDGMIDQQSIDRAESPSTQAVITSVGRSPVDYMLAVQTQAGAGNHRERANKDDSSR